MSSNVNPYQACTLPRNVFPMTRSATRWPIVPMVPTSLFIAELTNAPVFKITDVTTNVLTRKKALGEAALLETTVQYMYF